MPADIDLRNLLQRVARYDESNVLACSAASGAWNRDIAGQQIWNPSSFQECGELCEPSLERAGTNRTFRCRGVAPGALRLVAVAVFPGPGLSFATTVHT